MQYVLFIDIYTDVYLYLYSFFLTLEVIYQLPTNFLAFYFY